MADEAKVSSPKRSAAGVPSVAHSLRQALAEMGPRRSLQALLATNQTHGFDCPSCAWPDPDDRKTAEFCENGAKAVAWEATRKRVDAAFFAAHSVAVSIGRGSPFVARTGPVGMDMPLNAPNPRRPRNDL